MDNLTHSLFGLTLARTQLGRAGRGTTAALLLASNAPDIDIVATAGGATKYLEWHRGPTHGPLGVIGLAFVTAALVWGYGRRRSASTAAEPRATFPMLWAVSMVGVLCHIGMDLPTSYGTRPLSPFDWHWFAEDWMPIVDIYLLMALGAGLLFGRASVAAGRRNAAIVLLFMAVNYGVRAEAHHQALVQAPRLFGPLLPPPCDGAATQTRWIDRWPRDSTAASRDQMSRCLVEIAATPAFISPFQWRVIAHLSNAYELHDIDLLDRRIGTTPGGREGLWRRSIRYPNQWTPAVTRAATSRVAQVFLGFSRFPAARSAVDRDGFATVRWSDMRFVMGTLGDQRPRQANLFGATVRMDPDGRFVHEQLGP